MAVTTPAAETVASAVLEDDQTASDVTSCVVPSDIVAVALNWDVGLALTDGAVPVTLRDDTVLGEVVELWQAAENPTNATTIASERVHRIMRASRECRRCPGWCSRRATEVIRQPIPLLRAFSSRPVNCRADSSDIRNRAPRDLWHLCCRRRAISPQRRSPTTCREELKGSG